MLIFAGLGNPGARYARNRDVMVAGMRALGFETLLDDRWLSPIIVTFFTPADANFEFNRFYELMKAKGFIIYPGKLTVVDSFRIGVIGRMDEHVMARVVEAAHPRHHHIAVAGIAGATGGDTAFGFVQLQRFDEGTAL